jgi:hypothetical protein
VADENLGRQIGDRDLELEIVADNLVDLRSQGRDVRDGFTPEIRDEEILDEGGGYGYPGE